MCLSSDLIIIFICEQNIFLITEYIAVIAMSNNHRQHQNHYQHHHYYNILMIMAVNSLQNISINASIQVVIASIFFLLFFFVISFNV